MELFLNIIIKLIPTHNNNCYKCRILIQIIIILTVFLALHEENVLLSILLQLLAHESVEQRTFCGKAVALHEENVILSMLLQLLANTYTQ
jgi:hypothetical protein